MPDRVVACPDKFRGTLDCGRGRRGDGAGPAHGRVRGRGRGAAGRRRRGHARRAARGAAVARAAPRRSPDRSATRSTRSGAALPDGTAVVEMARASGLALVDGRTDPLRGEHRGHRRADRGGGCAAGATRVIVGVGGSATTDGGLAAVRGARLVARRARRGRWRATSRPPFTDAAEVYGPQKGAIGARRSRC